MPACAATSQATVGFGYGAQGEQARGPVVGVVQRFQGGLEIFDGQLAIRSQFGDFRGVVRYRALELAHACLRFHSCHNAWATLMSPAWLPLSPPHSSKTTALPCRPQ